MGGRKGQQTFRRRLLEHTGFCEATLCDKTFILDACHIKPHAFCTDEEKMDPNNAICLMANIHRAFDAGYISFDEEGWIMLSELLNDDDKFSFGLTGKERIRLSGKRPEYLAFHRENIFKLN